MNINQMRTALTQKYSKRYVDGLTDNQVLAVYRRLQSKNQI